MRQGKWLAVLIILLYSVSCFADRAVIRMYRTKKKGQGKSVGYVVATDTRYGLKLKPHLYGLPPGLHGFHVHQNPNCDDFGLNAKGHFDPKHTGKHLGPYNNKGHLGDLPVLYVNSEGKTTVPTMAPRLKVSDLKQHALIIHAGGDNYSDKPEKLGGGGARIACGIY